MTTKSLSGTIPAMVRDATIFALLAVLSLSVIATADTSKSSEGIENRRWRIAKYRNDANDKKDDNGLVDTKFGAEITFLNGRVEGSPGCGAWGGTYELAGNQLTVVAGTVSNGRCYPEQSSESDLIENAFKGELRIEQRDGRVYLHENRGRAQVMLVPY